MLSIACCFLHADLFADDRKMFVEIICNVSKLQGRTKKSLKKMCLEVVGVFSNSHLYSIYNWRRNVPNVSLCVLFCPTGH